MYNPPEPKSFFVVFSKEKTRIQDFVPPKKMEHETSYNYDDYSEESYP